MRGGDGQMIKRGLVRRRSFGRGASERALVRLHAHLILVDLNDSLLKEWIVRR